MSNLNLCTSSIADVWRGWARGYPGQLDLLSALASLVTALSVGDLRFRRLLGILFLVSGSEVACKRARLRERHLADGAHEGPQIDVSLVVHDQTRALDEYAIAYLAKFVVGTNVLATEV